MHACSRLAEKRSCSRVWGPFWRSQLAAGAGNQNTNSVAEWRAHHHQGCKARLLVPRTRYTYSKYIQAYVQFQLDPAWFRSSRVAVRAHHALSSESGQLLLVQPPPGGVWLVCFRTALHGKPASGKWGLLGDLCTADPSRKRRNTHELP